MINERARVSTHDKKTILLVEDEAIIALALEKDLQRFGFKVCVAYTGEKAVEYALSEPRINLVLTVWTLEPALMELRPQNGSCLTESCR